MCSIGNSGKGKDLEEKIRCVKDFVPIVVEGGGGDGDDGGLRVKELDRQILCLSEELGRPVGDMLKKVKASVAGDFRGGGKVEVKNVGKKLQGREVSYGARSRSITHQVVSTRVLNFQNPTLTVDGKGKNPSKRRDLRPKIEQPKAGPGGTARAFAKKLSAQGKNSTMRQAFTPSGSYRQRAVSGVEAQRNLSLSPLPMGGSSGSQVGKLETRKVSRRPETN